MTRKTSATAAREPNWRALLAVASELERWVGAQSRAPLDARESWEDLQRAQAKLEAGLMTKLERLPGCTVTITQRGLLTTMLLAGVEVRSYEGVRGACRAWINTVRDGALRSSRPTS